MIDINHLKKEFIKALWYVGKIDNYQSIEFPDGTLLKGFRRTEQTWNLIASHMGFKNKTVLDVGCNMGYFLIKACEAGAKKGYGVDQNIGSNPIEGELETYKKMVRPLDVAVEIAGLWGFDIEFMEGDWLDIYFDPIIDADITFCLNTLRYLKNQKEALQKMFNCTREAVIFEEPSLIFVPDEFQQVACIPGHWNTRNIRIFKRKNGLT